MTHSYADRPKIPCPECGRAFRPEIWLIIDAAARPDLLARVIDGTIHQFACPKGHTGTVDAPLLLYRPDDSPTLLFSPARGTTAEQDRDNARGLLGHLHAGLGSAWRDEWLADGLETIPRSRLASMLDREHATDTESIPPAMATLLETINADLTRAGIVSKPIEDIVRELAVHPEMRDQLIAAVAELAAADAIAAATRQADRAKEPAPSLTAMIQAFTLAGSWVGSYGYLIAHPELLSDEADMELTRMIGAATTAGNTLAVKALTEYLELLRRSRAEGAFSAFAEKIGEALDTSLQQGEPAEAQLPPEERQLFEEVMAALAAEGVVPESPEDLARAIEEQPDARQKLAAALAESKSDVPEVLQARIHQATTAEQRYQVTSERAALNEAAEAWQRVMDDPAFIAAPEQFQLATFNNAGGVFIRRFWAAGHLDDLDRALALWQDALQRAPADFTDRPMILNNLATGLHDRYLRLGQPADLNAAITAWENAIARSPADSPDLTRFRSNLANGLLDRATLMEQEVDLNAAIAIWRDAIARTPANSPDQAMYLGNLGLGLAKRYDHTGELADLDAAIAAWQDAVARTLRNSPNRASNLNRLGGGLIRRFAHTEQPADLDAAIDAWEAALHRMPADSPDREAIQSNLALARRNRKAHNRRWKWPSFRRG